MIQVLVNQTNFDGEWAAESLYSLFRPDQKVLLIPLSSNTGYAMEYDNWAEKFSENSIYREDIMRPFMRYGIPKNNIRVLSHYEDDEEYLRKMILQADVVCLIAEDEMSAYSCMLDLRMTSIFEEYDGILMFIGYAATPLTESFPVYSEEENGYFNCAGLDYLKDIDLIMNYEQTDDLLQYISCIIEMNGKKVIICPKNSGVIINDGNITLFGEAFIADEKDLDEIYNLYKE